MAPRRSLREYAPAPMEHVTLSVPAAPEFRGVVRLVVGGIASRCGLSFEHVDDLQMAVDALLNSQRTATEELELDASIGECLRLRVGPFDDRGGDSSQRVLRALVPGVQTVALGGHEWIELALPLPISGEDGA